jgi:alpha-galactosidase
MGFLMCSFIQVRPGPPLSFDEWIPSVLFLTHYLPDDPQKSQMINIASLVLGQNGIWGDLLSISNEGIERFGNYLSIYKQVRNDITEAQMVTHGVVGSSLEVREKISAKNGRGVVSIFCEVRGKYSYITKNSVSNLYRCSEGIKVKLLDSGRARIDMEFDGTNAGMVFFGVS